MNVDQLPTGRWAIIVDGDVVREFDTQAAAWKWIDRNEVHPLGIRRSTADRWEEWSLPKKGVS